MAYPKHTVLISTKGDVIVEGEEKTDACSMLSELAKQAGKVTKDEFKDHTPVYQTVSQKGA